MHTCPPPIDALNEWLEEYSSVNGRYGHLLLEQKKKSDDDLVNSLRPYFESAHLDARVCFHAEIGLDLHPDAGDIGAHAQYPMCLPPKARRGLFGELMAGLVTEAYSFVGNYNWKIPIFLFRYHENVGAYMFELARDPTRVREVWGRFGNDFVAISLQEDGSVGRVIVGEAKWRQKLTKSVVDTLMLGDFVPDPHNPGQRIRSGKGVWCQVNRDLPIPRGLRQLQQLLEENDPDEYSAAIYSMDKALLLTATEPIPRTDLILLVGKSGRRRKKKATLIEWEEMPDEYQTDNNLQVVEIFLTDGEVLMDEIYNTMWAEDLADA